MPYAYEIDAEARVRMTRAVGAPDPDEIRIFRDAVEAWDWTTR